jgi:hypothetical protein
VQAARHVLLSRLYEEFPVHDTLREYHSIWYALKWAYDAWDRTLKYVVLLGDDSVGVVGGDTTRWNTGPMPTFVRYRQIYRSAITAGDTTYDTMYDISDTYYALCELDEPPDIPGTVSYLSAQPVFAVGRIPCENAAECEAYIDKLVQFDLLPARGAWRNRVVMCADDRFQDSLADPLWAVSPHPLSAERVAGKLGAYFVDKPYLSRFMKDSQGDHSLARSAYFGLVNRGALWSVYFGHGHASCLSDELFLGVSSTELFHNDIQPVIFCSFACSNGAFHVPRDSSMCKRFLTKPVGGAIAFVASPVKTYASDNEKLAESFFAQVAGDTSRGLGTCLIMAQHDNLSKNSKYYAVLGDPAVSAATKRVHMSVEIHKPANTALVFVAQLQSPPPGTWACHYRFTQPVRVAFLDDTVRSCVVDSVIDSATVAMDGPLEVPLPDADGLDTVKFAIYAWGGDAEARAETTVAAAKMGVAAPPVSRALPGSIRIAGDVVEFRWGAAAIYDLRGRIVHRRLIDASRNGGRIRLSSLGLASGRYVVEMRASGSVVRRCLVFSKARP